MPESLKKYEDIVKVNIPKKKIRRKEGNKKLQHEKQRAI